MILPDGVVRPGGLELTRRILDCCGFPCGARVIDVGCGSGVTVEYLRDRLGLDAVGVDVCEAAVQEGKARCACLPLVHGAAEELPFPDGSAAGVLAECSLSTMQEPGKVLREVFRVLAAGGKLGMTDIYLRRTGELADAGNCGELMELLGGAGFRTLLWEDHSSCVKEFVARFILANGSQEELWRCLSEKNRQMLPYRSAAKEEKWGYFLLVAEKPA